MEISTFILTVLYILVGAIIGLGFDNLKGYLKNRKITKSIRTLIDLEMEKNKELLKDYWESVAKSKKIWISDLGEFNYVTLAYAINDIPFPYLSKIAWNNNLNSIPSIYSSNEIKNLWTLYENYNLLFEIKGHLFIKENEAENIGARTESRIGSNVAGNFVAFIHFQGDAPVLAKKFKSIIETIVGSNTIKFVNKSEDNLSNV